MNSRMAAPSFTASAVRQARFIARDRIFISAVQKGVAFVCHSVISIDAQ
jgi:hypothetical protein